jgi:uncharacterized protein YacL
MLYTAFLVIHSYIRWLVLAAGVIAVVRGIAGVAGRKPWEPADEAAGKWFIIGLDVQMLIGAVIYFFLSPFTMSAWGDMAETMRNAPLRLIVVEHQVGMIIGLALAHIGRARIRKAADAVRRHRLAAIFFGLAMVVILLSIPWPFMPGGRALFRGFE